MIYLFACAVRRVPAKEGRVRSLSRDKRASHERRMRGESLYVGVSAHVAIVHSSKASVELVRRTRFRRPALSERDSCGEHAAKGSRPHA